MRVISFRDLKLALPQFKNEMEMIHKESDEVVRNVLSTLGFNMNHKIDYVVAMHRDMQNKTGVGFMAVGEYSLDPQYKQFLDTMDRTIVASMQDPSLGREMSQLMGKHMTYKNSDEPSGSKLVENDHRYYSKEQLAELGYTGMEADADDEDFYEEYGGVESDYEMISSQIDALTALRISIRGE